MTDRSTLKPGDWLRCTLPKLTTLYGRWCRVVSVPAPDKGVRVAFLFVPRGHKPYRTALSPGHWLREDPDTITLLADIVK
jgi:hypothetical protein